MSDCKSQLDNSDFRNLDRELSCVLIGDVMSDVGILVICANV